MKEKEMEMVQAPTCGLEIGNRERCGACGQKVADKGVELFNLIGLNGE